MYGQPQYGTFIYSDEINKDSDISPFVPDLMEYLPPYYRGIYEMTEIQKVTANKIGYLKFLADDIFKQLFIDTATWGLLYWEKDLNITTDISKSELFRREVILAKLRGQGTVTKKLIKNTAETFTNAEVEVIEKNKDSFFIIKFIGIKGIPLNMAGLIEVIENIKPAHLQYKFEYSYTWWDTLRYEKPITWNSANLQTWNELRVY